MTAETPGRTHVLALGISDYQGQPLRYAHEDAQVHRGVPGPQGTGPARRGRADRAASTPGDAQGGGRGLRGAPRDRVRRRPEDTVVIFLAGHTTVRRGRFCLLLPNADLPDQPIVPGVLALRAPTGGRAAQGRDALCRTS